MAQQHATAAHGESHGHSSVKSYVIGFVLAVILTVIPSHQSGANRVTGAGGGAPTPAPASCMAANQCRIRAGGSASRTADNKKRGPRAPSSLHA